MGDLISKSEQGTKKSEAKDEWDKPLFNRYDPYMIKGKLDEYLIHELNTTYKFNQQFKYSNTKLLIGAIAVMFTTICHVYEYVFDAHFPKDYNITFVCVIGYFTFNLLYQCYENYYEQETFYQSNPNIKNINSIDISSTMPKFDKHYNLTVFVYSSSQQVFKLVYSPSVEEFFSEDGYMVKQSVNKFIKEIVQSISRKHN